MIADQLQSHLNSAQDLLQQNSLDDASREAELAVDQYWMMGDARIAAALPLLSLIRHSSGLKGSLFSGLDDLPKSLSPDLLREATLLHEKSINDASAKMLSDVKSFLGFCAGEVEAGEADEAQSESDGADEKVEELVAQIEQLKAMGDKKLAVEVALELANEYASLDKNRRAFKLFKQVLQKSRRYGQTELRIDGLLDFGQFFSKLGKVEEAERVLRLAAGVAKNASDRDRYSHVIAALGVVLAHAGKQSAEKHLQKASSLLSPWDVEADIVNHHLEAIRDGKSCDCPEANGVSTASGIDWN